MYMNANTYSAEIAYPLAFGETTRAKNTQYWSNKIQLSRHFPVQTKICSLSLRVHE